jgi:hypothetical protein
MALTGSVHEGIGKGSGNGAHWCHFGEGPVSSEPVLRSQLQDLAQESNSSAAAK